MTDILERETERRFTTVAVELRQRNNQGRIGGYASVFNRYSQNLGGFVEVVDPEFFNDSRASGWPDVICRYNHDDNMLLGTSAGGTLALEIDGTGLLYDVSPPQARSDILELVERGDVAKSSFAFRVAPAGEEWGLTDQKFPLRRLLSGQLVDVAPVNIPAYTDSTVGLRSLANFKQIPVEEVRALAQADDLRKLFMRTDKSGKPKSNKPGMFGPAAAAELLGNKQDPWA